MGKRTIPHSQPEAMAKRQKLVPDRLSNLQDSVLTHILSFLPTKDVVRTCVLSKRWHNTWTSVPALDFSVDKPSDLEFIEEVLSRRSAINISRFHILLPNSWCGPPLTYRVDSWVDYAVKHNVVDVKITLLHEEFTEVIFLDTLFNHQPLESLELDLVMSDSLVCDDPIEWSSRYSLTKLRKLNIKICGKIFGKSLVGLLSNCPVLEELSLDSWFDDLDISSSSLKKLHLTIQDCTEIKISCPNLELFEFNYHSCQKGFGSFIGHMPSLIQANIEMYKTFGNRDYKFMRQLRNSLPDTADVKIRYEEEHCSFAMESVAEKISF